MTRAQGILGVVIVGMFIAMLSFHVFIIKHASVGRHSSTYQIDMEYEQVKKILTRTDALQEIVSSQHGKLVDRKWDSLNLSTDRILKGFDVNGEGHFTVVSEHPHVGRMTLHFRQRVAITKTSLRSETWLTHPCGHIKEISTYTEMVPDGTQTRVKNDVHLRYERRIPKNYVAYMDQQVSEACVRMTQNSQKVITDLVERYRGKRIILPIKRSKE